MTRLRIGISALYRMNGGSLTYLSQLFRAWAEEGIDRSHDIVLFVRDESIPQIRSVITPNIALHSVGAGGLGSVQKILWEQVWFPRLLQRERIDVLFSTANTTPIFGSTPRVVALRNAGPFCPTIRIRTVGFKLWIYMKIVGVFMRLSAFRATRVIFISEYFRDIFLRLGLRPNVIELIDAYDRSRNYFVTRGLKLAIVGNPIDVRYAESVRSQVEKLGLNEHVILTCGVSHEEIHTLMAHCELFIFQSTCENCPNTLIEALAAGLPIACSSSGVMPEIAGDAAVYFDPFDPDDIGRALRRILDDPQRGRELRERALAQSQKFPTWREVGRRTFETLQAAAQARS